MVKLGIRLGQLKLHSRNLVLLNVAQSKRGDVATTACVIWNQTLHDHSCLRFVQTVRYSCWKVQENLINGRLVSNNEFVI